MDTTPTGGSRRPPEDRGQAGPVGYLLIVGLTVSVAMGIVIFGGSVIEASQDDSRINQAELALTQFDSKSAQVALDDSDQQRIAFGTRDGTYRVDEDAGRIVMYHDNWTGDDSQEKREYIYGNDTDWVPLGSVVYDRQGTQIAYQGGGVWRKDADGGSTMVSPPEFQYRRATLTYPIIRVTGSGSGSGNVKASVTKSKPTQSVFPDRTQHYDGLDNPPYSNPVKNGTMTVELQSEYCEAWKRYFEQRTEGEVSKCDEDDVVTAELITLGTQGDFSITGGSEILLRGLENEDDLESLNFTFGSDSSADFNNYGWSIYGESGDQQFELYIENRGSGDNCGNDVRVVYYYSNDGGKTYQTWVVDGANNIGQHSYTIECDDDGNEFLIVDMLNSTREMEYVDAANSDDGGKTDDLLEFDYEGSFDGGANPLGSDQEPVENVTRHYFETIGDMDLSIEERANGKGTGLSDDKSNGNIYYTGGGDVVTFLHVTENEVRVELE